MQHFASDPIRATDTTLVEPETGDDENKQTQTCACSSSQRGIIEH